MVGLQIISFMRTGTVAVVYAPNTKILQIHSQLTLVFWKKENPEVSTRQYAAQSRYSWSSEGGVGCAVSRGGLGRPLEEVRPKQNLTEQEFTRQRRS